jgi:hypothetical protein
MTRPAEEHHGATAVLRTLSELNARFIENHVTNDVASHDSMLHRQFLYINSQGARVPRAEYLRQWATGFDPRVIVYWDTRDELITVLGNVALVRATNKFVLRKGANEEVGMATYTDIYLHEEGKWSCIQAQITPVAADNQPDDATIISVYVNGVRQPGT